jgi:hypothetical protein
MEEMTEEMMECLLSIMEEIRAEMNANHEELKA